MASIGITLENSILILTVVGNITAEEMVGVVNENYASGNVKHVIWDFTNGSLKTISLAGFKELAKATKESVVNGSRPDGITVFVGKNAEEFGSISLYSTIAEMAGIPINYQVCKTIEEARKRIKRESRLKQWENM